MIKIGSNIDALKAQRALGNATNALSKVFERPSSGQRITKASDDAAGLAISSSLKASIRMYTQAVRNINDGASFLSIAQGGLQQLEGINERQLELATEAANGVYTSKQRDALNNEAQQLGAEFNRIVSITKFNNQQIFTGGPSTLRIQAGVGVNESLGLSVGGQLSRTIAKGTLSSDVQSSLGFKVNQIAVGDFNGDGKDDIVTASYDQSSLVLQLSNGNGTFQAPVNLGLSSYSVVSGDFDGDGIADIVSGGGDENNVFLQNTTTTQNESLFSLKTQENARSAITTLTAQRLRISNELGQIGSAQSRLGVALNTVSNTVLTYSQASSRITDVDVAEESSNLVRQQILQQAAASVLSQADQEPALVLQLLR